MLKKLNRLHAEYNHECRYTFLFSSIAWKFFFFCLIISTGFASAQLPSFYVGTNGDDNASGTTAESAWRIIQNGGQVASETYKFIEKWWHADPTMSADLESMMRYSLYYLTAHPELLDLPGEWWYDTETKRLYLYPVEGGDINPATLNIEIPLFNTVINLNAQDNTLLDGLVIRYGNVDKRTGDTLHAAINQEGTKGLNGITIRNCTIEYWGRGLTFWLMESTTESIQNVTLEKWGYPNGYSGHGFYLDINNSGVEMSDNKLLNNTHFRVRENSGAANVYYQNIFENLDIGINLSNTSGKTRISYNQFNNIPETAIQINGDTIGMYADYDRFQNCTNLLRLNDKFFKTLSIVRQSTPYEQHGTIGPPLSTQISKLDVIQVLNNPYQGVGEIEFTNLPAGVRLSIYSIRGDLIMNLSAHSSNVAYTWNGRNEKGVAVNPGIYIARISNSNEHRASKNMVLSP